MSSTSDLITIGQAQAISERTLQEIANLATTTTEAISEIATNSLPVYVGSTAPTVDSIWLKTSGS